MRKEVSTSEGSSYQGNREEQRQHLSKLAVWTAMDGHLGYR